MPNTFSASCGSEARVIVLVDGEDVTCAGLSIRIGDGLFPVTSDEIIGPPVSTSDTRLAASAFSRMTGADFEAVLAALMRARRGDRAPLGEFLARHRFDYLRGIRASNLLTYLARIEGEHVTRRRAVERSA